LARAGRPDQQDVALAKLDLALLVTLIEAFVVVVDRYRQHLLGALLTDHVLVKNPADFFGRRKFVRAAFRLSFLHLLADDVVAQVDAFVADEYGGTGNQFAHFVLAFAAERAIEQLAGVLAVAGVSHSIDPIRVGMNTRWGQLRAFSSPPGSRRKS